VWKSDLSRNADAFFGKFLDPNPETADFQNLTSFSMSKDISGKIFINILSVVNVKLLKDKQTYNRQTNNVD